VLFKVRPPTSVAALVEEADDKTAVEDFPHPDAVQLLVAPRPFAKGAVRLAYHAQELPTATAVAGAATTALGYVGSVVLGLGFAQASSLSPSAGAGLHSGIMGNTEPCTYCCHYTHCTYYNHYSPCIQTPPHLTYSPAHMNTYSHRSVSRDEGVA